MTRNAKKDETNSNFVYGIIVSAILLVIGLMASNILVMAEDHIGSSFFIRPILPDNQERKESTFFDLRIEPGQEQVIDVEIVNNTNERIKILATIFTATTNMNGFAEYQLSPEKPDSTLPHLMEDIISLPAYVEIPPHAVHFLPIHIQMPDESYDGVWAAALDLRRAEEEEVEFEGIRNIYSFVTVILLHQGEALEAEIVSHGTQIEFLEDKGLFSTNLQNTKAAFTSLLEIKTTITCRETNEMVFKEVRGNMQMAPHSNFDFLVQADSNNFSEGIYILDHVLESGGITWKFQEFIRVSGEIDLEAHSLTEDEMRALERNSSVWIILVVSLLLAVIIIIFCVYLIPKPFPNFL